MSDALQPHGLTAAGQASVSFTVSWSLFRRMPLESVALSNPLILCRTLLCLPSVFPSVRVFSKESALHVRWPKYWSFSFGNSYQCVDSKKEQGAVGKVFQRSAPEATNCAFLLSLDLGAGGAFRLEFPLTASSPLSTALFKDAYRMDGSPVSFVSVWFPPHSLPCMGSHRNTGTVTRVSLDAALPVICVKGTLRYLQRDAWWLWTN